MKRSLSFRARSQCVRGGTFVDVLFIYFGRNDVDMTVVTDEVQNALKVKDPIPDCVILLSHGDQAERLADVWRKNAGRAKVLMSRGRTPTMTYLKELSIWGFTAGKFVHLHADAESNASFNLDIPDLLRVGLGNLVESHNAYQIAPAGHVFRHPSGKQTKRFFLASELVKDEIDAYFVALCICASAWGLLERTKTLHIDTMGIYPIARAMEEICLRNDGAGNSSWEISSFHSHTGLDTLHQAFSEQQVVLISASTSGSMASKLAEDGVPERVLITVLDITDECRVGTVVHAHDKYLKRRYGALQSVDAPSIEETVIELTGEYFAATGKKPRPLTLGVDHAPKALQKILTAFSREKVCCLNSLRKNGTSTIDLISIDEESIVSDKDFREWVQEELRLKTPVSVTHVVALPGEGARQLAEFCAQELATYRQAAPKVVERDDIHALGADTVNGVVVCAPLVGNGHALRVIARDLREVAPRASRHFLLGVGLPETMDSWGRLRQFLAQSGKPTRPYPVSEWLFLPLGTKSGRVEAWKRGDELMSRTEHTEPLPAIGWDVATVKESLRLAGNALEKAETHFLPTTAGSALKLTRGFVYWDAKPEAIAAADHLATSYLAMTSALQTAREFELPARRLRSSLHETVVLDPENFLRFNDGVLQASLLRAAYASELNYSATPELSQMMREFLEKVFLNHAREYGEAALEFAFALACGHLRLTPEDTKLLTTRLGELGRDASALIGFLYYAWEGVQTKPAAQP